MFIAFFSVFLGCDHANANNSTFLALELPATETRQKFPAGTNYLPIANLPFTSEVKDIHNEYYHDVKFDAKVYRPASSEYDDDLVTKAIYLSTYHSFHKIEALGLIDRQCTRGIQLDIFEIPESELNNVSRFPAEYVENPATGATKLWGFFDPRNDTPFVNAIVVSPQSREQDIKILAHEIAHYWYANFCVSYSTKQTSEEFAREIEGKVQLYPSKKNTFKKNRIVDGVILRPFHQELIADPEYELPSTPKKKSWFHFRKRH
jgi:hypothetical protein